MKRTVASCSSHVLMVRPANFGYNAQTAGTNAFQSVPDSKQNTAKLARAEFDDMASALRGAGVDVRVIEDTAQPVKPDAVFPNNWLSLHPDGTAVLYPMESPNRRTERRLDIVEGLRATHQIQSVIDLSSGEAHGRFLEGTGSILFDHAHRKAYACLSRRTDPSLLEMLCEELGYSPQTFTATDRNGQEIYHTNVMMCIGPSFAVVCLESIADEGERSVLVDSLENDGKQIIPISREQMRSYAGNMLALETLEGAPLLVMSSSARGVLTDDQLAALASHATLLAFDIPTIETVGGGSVRCMLCENFLPAHG
jgi:hypothetical protein